MTGQIDDATHPLSTRQTTSLFVDTDHTYTHLVSVWIFDSVDHGPIDSTALRSWMRERLDICPILTRRVHRAAFDLDVPHWVHAEPEIDRHVHVTTLTSPGMNALTAEVARIANCPMDRSRPLWELHAINDVRGIENIPDHATAVVLKFHHCVGDGVESVALARRLFGDTTATWTMSRPSMPKITWSRVPALALGQIRQLRYALAEIDASSRALETAVESGSVAPTPEPVPSTRFNGAATPEWTVGVARFRLADVQAIRRSVGEVTVHDVMVTVVALALSNYLTYVGDSTPSALTAASPKSVYSVQRRASEPNLGSNSFSTMLVDLHPEVVDPVERLRAVATSTRQEKARVDDPRSTRAEHVMDHWPMWLIRYAMWRQKRVASKPSTTVGSTVVVTNVPRGPKEGLALMGRPAVDGFGVLGVADQSTLQHVISSLGDRISVTFTACAETMPDGTPYSDALQRAFCDLRDAAG